MTTLRDQVLEKLSTAEYPITLPRLAKALGLGPRQHPEITRELTILHREHRVHVANGGGWSLLNGDVTPPVTADTAARATSRGKGEIQVKILAELAGGEKTRAELVTALHPDKRPIDVDQALHRIWKTRLVVRVRPGVYGLPGDDGADASAPYPESVKAEARRLIGEAREQRLSKTETVAAPPSDADPAPLLTPALPEFVPGVLQEAVPPRSDLRDLLMRGAERVLAGDMDKDGAEALVELVDAILAIDLGEVGA